MAFITTWGREEKRSSSSWDVPQKPESIVAYLKDSPGETLLKKYWKPNCKSRGGVCLVNPNWRVVPHLKPP